MTETASQPAEPLLAFILSVLTPFLGAGSLAAATQAIAAYKASGPDQLISVAQIVAFALASLDSIRLSATGDPSVSMKLRLRGNANALTRTTHRATAILENQRQAQQTATQQAGTQPQVHPQQAPADPDVPPPTPQPTEAPKQIWANAMHQVAAECARNLANLPPKQRRAETIRIAAISDTARYLAAGGATPSKSTLLATTAMPPT